MTDSFRRLFPQGFVHTKRLFPRKKPKGQNGNLGCKFGGSLKVRMGPGPYFAVGTEIPVNWTISPGFNGQGGPNRRAAMAEHAAGGRTRSPTGLLRSARDLHSNIPTF